MPGCSPFNNSKTSKKNEIEDLNYYLGNTLSRTDDILVRFKSVSSDVNVRRNSTETNAKTSYDLICNNLQEIDNNLKKTQDALDKIRTDRDETKVKYNTLLKDTEILQQKFEDIESEVINLRHNNLVLDYQKNPLKAGKVEELEDGYVDLYGTYKRTIRDSKDQMEDMKKHYENVTEEQRTKIEELKLNLASMRSIQQDFAVEIKKMGDEFKEKEDIMISVIQKLQEENKRLKEEKNGQT